MPEITLKPNTDGVKFGPFWLSPRIRPYNAVTFFFSSFTFVILATSLGFVQPYVLEEILHIPAERQGSVTGMLGLVHEGIAFIIMGIIGAISDNHGRRTILVIGLLIWAAGLAVFPTADSLLQLYIFRVVIAVGVAIASVMVISAMQDYPQEVSRGKWGGVNSFLTTFAILTVSLGLARLPTAFQAAGNDAVQAGRLTFWVAAGVALLAALVIRFGYYGGRIAGDAPKKSPFEGFMGGVRAVRGRPRLALAYASAFAARGDMIVLGTFYSLWFVRAGADQGISAADAIKTGGMTMFAMIVAVWIWAPIFGFILDRINRIKGLLIAFLLAAMGYFTLGQVDDPYNTTVMLAATFVLGIGEISAVIIGNILIGQEAPPKIRGACVGVWGLVGTIGILCAQYFGGQVFDIFGYGAPFTMMAGVNAIIVVWAGVLWVTGRHRYEAHSTAESLDS